MRPDDSTPVSVRFSRALIRIAARLVPVPRRQDWEEEWFAEIWHRWQFLFHAGAWNKREALSLTRNCLGAFPDAAALLILQENVYARLRSLARSPRVCLAALLVPLLGVAVFSSGFPATRQLLISPWQHNVSGLLFIWRHPVMTGGDRGLPPDVVPAWASESRLLEGAAGFTISQRSLLAPKSAPFQPLVVISDPRLFQVLKMTPVLGTVPKNSGVILDHRTWVSLYGANAGIIGSRVAIGNALFPIAGVLPASFPVLTRQPTVYLVEPQVPGRRVMVVARARAGASERQIDSELTKIAEDATYYFFRSELRFKFVKGAFLAPLGLFTLAISIATLLLVAAYRPNPVRAYRAWKTGDRKPMIRRAAFFSAKLALSLAFLFTAALEWSRSNSALLFGSRDPGSGPVLLWIYIAGSMWVFFWALADQRARCRVCLRLLCFPVRVGCPGCLLLDWSGTELLCTEGHGVLHVPHLAPSWAEEPEHWIALDESWHDLFAAAK